MGPVGQAGLAERGAEPRLRRGESTLALHQADCFTRCWPRAAWTKSRRVVHRAASAVLDDAVDVDAPRDWVVVGAETSAASSLVMPRPDPRRPMARLPGGDDFPQRIVGR